MRRTVGWAGTMATLLVAPGLRAQEARPLIAVLPFENTGSYGQDKETFQAFEVGLPEILAATLAAHPSGRVVERSRLRQALEQQKLGGAHRIDAASATQVAKAVDARYAIAGSFADFYGKFRINARVVDAQRGEIIKVVSNDDPKLQDRAELGAILQLVGNRIAQALALPPYPADLASRRRALPTEALTEFCRGLLFEGRGDRAKAAEAYQRALTVAPDFPEARDALQRVHAG